MRYRIIIFFFLLFTTLFVRAQLQQYKIEQIDSLQRLQPKPVLVFMYADWCVYCKQMRYTTFRNKELIDVLNKAFYVISFNGEQQTDVYFRGKKFGFVPTGTETGYHEVLFALGMPHREIGYPSTSFLRPDLSVIDNASGYLSAKELLAAIRKIVQ
ncbi:MAG: thioredoxin fold domain-containing protein [Chitinophagaceae bacterium]|nr:thioredoxin fold domain-containing protein [Chitinophagaceae bacterium]